jgi:4-amino-4-deoxy-L-arabinose transferase-like glycosyltransferase
MPGHPLFIFLVLAVQGAPHYSELVNCWRTGMEGICTQQLNSIVYAQGVIAVIAALEFYVLVWRLSHRRGVVALATSLIALNILFGNSERLVLTEFLSYWATLSVFLVFERLVRRPSILRSCIFALTCVAGIAIRPFNVYLPVVLLLLLGGWYMWTHQLKARLAAVLSAIAVLSVCILGYMALNARYNNYFGLSWETNITLFGQER